MYHHGFVLVAAWIYAAFLAVNRTFLADQAVSPYLFAFASVLSTGFVSMLFLICARPWSALKTLDRHVWVMLLIHGVLMGGVARFILCYAQAFSSIITAGFLTRISPLFAVILSYLLLRETLTPSRVLVIVAMTVGGILVSTQGTLSLSSLHQGDLLLLFYAVILGFDQVWTRKIITRGVQTMMVTAMRFIVGAVATGVVFGSQALLSTTHIDFGISSLFADNIHTGNVLLGGLLSGLLLFGTVCARDLGLAHLPASIVSALMLWSPVFSALMGLALLHEHLSLGQAMGSVVILGGGYFLSQKAPCHAPIDTAKSSEEGRCTDDSEIIRQDAMRSYRTVPL